MSKLFLQILFTYTCECTNIFPMLNIYIYDHTLTLKYLQKNFKNKKKELGTKEFEDCHSMQKNLPPCHFKKGNLYYNLKMIG